MTSRTDGSWGGAEVAPHGSVPGDPSARRGSLPDLILAAVYLVVALFCIYLSVESSIVTPLWPMLLLTAGGVATLAIRHQRPTLALVAALVLLPASFAWGTGAEIILLVPLLYRVGVDRPPRQAWTWLGVAALVGAVAAAIMVRRLHSGPPLLGVALRTPPPDWLWEWLSVYMFVGATLAVATLIGINTGHRRRYVAALVDRAEQMKRERDQQASIASAAERERIAREMHDVIAHSLAVMIALADGAQASAEKRPDVASEAISRVAETGRRTLGEVRRLLSRVRGEDEDEQAHLPKPGVAQLPSLVDGFREAGLPVNLELTGSLDGEPAVGLTVYRIVQESLTNVLRHARGVREVEVKVSLSEDDITVLVEDASSPARESSDPGRGLLGIRERASLYDGVVETGPREGGGWRVYVHLPVRSDERG